MRQRYLTTEQAATYLGYTTQYLRVLRMRGKGPPFIRLTAKSLRYDVEEIDRWMAEKRNENAVAGCSLATGQPRQQHNPEAVHE